jgi:hypothetical protein
MQKLVDMGWSTLHSQPYQEQGRLGGVHTLRLSLTCLSPRDVVVVVNACALLTVHWYTSQEHGVEAAHAFIMISGGNPMVKARPRVGGFVLCCEKDRYNATGFCNNLSNPTTLYFPLILPQWPPVSMASFWVLSEPCYNDLSCYCRASTRSPVGDRWLLFEFTDRVGTERSKEYEYSAHKRKYSTIFTFQIIDFKSSSK